MRNQNTKFDTLLEHAWSTLGQSENDLKEKYKDYLDIPMTTRLEIAENVYKILGQDNEFWCQSVIAVWTG